MIWLSFLNMRCLPPFHHSVMLGWPWVWRRARVYTLVSRPFPQHGEPGPGQGRLDFRSSVLRASETTTEQCGIFIHTFVVSYVFVDICWTVQAGDVTCQSVQTRAVQGHFEAGKFCEGHLNWGEPLMTPEVHPMSPGLDINHGICQTVPWAPQRKTIRPPAQTRQAIHFSQALCLYQ